MRKIRVLYYCVNSFGCQHYRIMQTKKYLEATGLFEIHLSQYVNGEDWVTCGDPQMPPTERKFDIVVFQRPHTNMSIKAVELLKKAGIPTIYDIDDLLTDIDSKSTCFQVYNKANETGLRNIYYFQQMVSNCDYVTVSTHSLRKELKMLNGRTVVIPNGMDLDYWKSPLVFPSYAKKPGEIIIGYSGSTTHLSDLQEIESAIVDVMNAHDNVKLALFGTDWKTIDTKETLVFAGIPESKKIYCPFVYNYQQYVDNLGVFDIGIAPLRMSRFNQSKSSIKYLELAMHSIPVIATDIEPYSIIRNGKTGFKLKNDVKKWRKVLTECIKNTALRQQIGQAAKKYAIENHNVNHVAKKLQYFFEGIFKTHKYLLPMQDVSKWEFRSSDMEATLIEDLKSRREG